MINKKKNNVMLNFIGWENIDYLQIYITNVDKIIFGLKVRNHLDRWE